jgi:hypothetical protein
MKESVKLFLEVTEFEMLASDEATMYVPFGCIAEYLDEDETIEEFYSTLTEVCGDYGFEWEKTNKTNHMWTAYETKHFDIILTKVG